MKWYYVDQGQQAGPVDAAQLEEMFRNGRIQRDTLVWCEGMANWAPFFEATAQAGAAAAAAAPPSEAVCSECGRMLPKNTMIRHGEAYICASCKPVFMQKLAEGAKLKTGAMNYAGFWTRFAALFLDGLILWVVGFLVELAAGVPPAEAVGLEGGSENLGLRLVLSLVQVAIGMSYEVFMIGRYGATLGKMACKIQVVTADGGRVGYLRAFGRYWAKVLSYMICLIGLIIAAFDEQKRALHDHICNTRVIFK